MALDEHIARLFTSNKAWADAVAAADPTFFPTTAQGQAPKILWIGCADSRVPESVLTASKPGDIFTHRNIANQVHVSDDATQAILAYAVGTVGVEHVIVVGHSNCGGAHACYKASLSPTPPGAPTDALSRFLAPLTALASSLNLAAAASEEEALRLLVDENVRVQVAQAAASAPVRKAWKEGRNVWVHGFVYDLATGRLRDLGVSRGPASAK